MNDGIGRRFPAIETERLVVRELTLDDLDAVHAMLAAAFGVGMSRDQRRRWLEWTVLGYEMFARLDQPTYGERAIVDRQGGSLVGAVGIVPYLEPLGMVDALRLESDPAPGMARAEMGLFWAIDPDHQGRGYAVEAASAVIDHLFAVEQLARVIATTGTANSRSRRVMEKLGMNVQVVERPQPPHQVVGVLTNPGAG